MLSSGLEDLTNIVNIEKERESKPTLFEVEVVGYRNSQPTMQNYLESHPLDRSMDRRGQPGNVSIEKKIKENQSFASCLDLGRSSSS